MPDREKVIDAFERCFCSRTASCPGCYKEGPGFGYVCRQSLCDDVLALLKEQGKKQITLQKKHVITWNRNDGFSMRKLYEAICETLLDEGELFIARTDNHEKVEFVFYVAEGR